MIKCATTKESLEVAGLALKLWPEHTLEALNEEMVGYIEGEYSAVFLAYEGDVAIGFAQCQLRHDYVEGTQTSPVGYLEGIFVDQAYRGKGVASTLLSACEAWAKERGSTEFASDCELTNEGSLRFHLKLGFIEANRIICFTKKISNM
ncbi:MAG: aminoglycoside 6'-N-acetyltransferase [Cellulosilyticaceae bacterium]